MSNAGRILFVSNPTARQGEAASLIPAIHQILGGNVQHETVLTEYAGHALELARDCTGFDTVVAVGGDGTVHEVVNGIMARPAGDRPQFSLLPAGSGNDYRRALGISEDFTTALLQLVAGRRQPVDLGTCNGTWFANSVGMGLDARVAAKSVELRYSTGWSGLPLYLRSLLSVLFNQYYSHPARVTVDDGETRDENFLVLAATNGPTYGGGFFITPDADPTDGLFDTCTIDFIPVYEALWRLAFVIPGKHTKMKCVHMGRCRKLLVECKTPIEAQMDGEVVIGDRFEIELHPGAMTCILPQLP